MLQIIRYLKGYLSIRVWGLSTERFINLCGNHDILLWNIVNHGEYYTMCISLKGFYQLRPITRKTGTRVVITSRYGLPFLMMRVKNRKVFLAGFCCSMLFWLWMSGFLWNITVQGNYYITDDMFSDFLSENGIIPGMKRKQINIEALEKEIRDSFEMITWTSARLDGTKLLIQIKENDLIKNEKKEVKDEGKAWDLVAARDGTVISIITRSGIPQVTEGDEVKKGDLLVEGRIPIYNEDAQIKRYEYCRADADIFLLYPFSVTEKLKETYNSRCYTGREIRRSYLLLGGKKLALPIFQNKYEMADILTSQEQLCVLGGCRLPVYFGKIRIREYETEEKLYTKKEIKEKFEAKIQKFIQTLEEKGVQIIEKNVTIKKCKGIWEMNADFVVSESAVKKRETKAVPLAQNRENE